MTFSVLSLARDLKLHANLCFSRVSHVDMDPDPRKDSVKKYETKGLHYTEVT